MKYSIFLLIAHFIVGCVLGEIADLEDWSGRDSNERVHFVFLSGQLNAKIKDGYEPVSLFDGKRLHFADTNKKVKPNGDMSCRMIPEVVVSDVYAEILDFDYKFTSRMAIREVNRAVANMLYTQTTNSILNDFERSNLSGALAEGNSGGESTQGGFDDLVGGGVVQEMQDLNMEESVFNRDINDHISKIVASANETPIKDTLQGQYSILSEGDIENAYCAISFTFDESNAQLRMKGIRRSVVRIVPVGFVQAGVPNIVRFNCGFSEYEIENPKFEILLFSGNGTPIANNYSPALKQMTSDQYERYMSLEGAEDLSVLR